MTGKTITRADLAEAVSEKVGLSKNEASDVVYAVLESICDAVVQEGMVKLSSFGTFKTRQKGQRIGRNPKTGQEVPILPRRVLTFRPSHILKKAINGDAE
jgi:integration host factor subunit alpha